MNATFFRCTCPPDVVDKSDYLTASSGIVTIRNYEAIDDISGYLYCSAAYDAYNYCALDGKYYFIGPREMMPAGIVRLHLQEDVLHTHRSTILNTDALVSRANAGANPYFAGDLPVLTFQRNSESAQPALEYDHDGKLYFVLVTAGGSTKTGGGLVTEQPNWQGW